MTVVDLVVNKIWDTDFQDSYKRDKKDFTRSRKLTFPILMLFMINFLRKSLVIEIVNFVSYLSSKCKFGIKDRFTKSAFTQARKKIKAEAFKDLSQTIVEAFYKDDEFSVKKWR